MHIYYDDGPPTVTMGEAGTFARGVSRDIDNKLAEQVLGKKRVQFKKGKKDAPATPAAEESAASAEQEAKA